MRRTICSTTMVLLCVLGHAVACMAADPEVKTSEDRDTLLYVRTVPPGAKVLLDGKELGTSDGVFHVEPGVGTIVVELDGHKPNAKQVTIRADGITRVELILKPKNDAEEKTAKNMEKPALAASDTLGNRDSDKAENILSNPGIENGTKTSAKGPSDWDEGDAIEGVTYFWDKQVAFEGKASLCIEKTAKKYFPIAQWSQTVDRKGNRPTLEVSAQVKAEKMTKAILDVVFLDKDDQWISHKWAAYIGSKKNGEPPANHDWKKYSGKVEIPPGTVKLCVALQVYGPGKVWFDDVQARYGIALAGSDSETPTTSPTTDTVPKSQPSRGNASQLSQQGWQLWSKGQHDEAAAKFKEAVNLAPRNENAWNGLGWACFNSGKQPEAKEAFERVIALNPNHPGALNGLGQMYLGQKKYDLTEKYLLKAAPKASAAWYGLARLYLLQGKFDQAEKYAQMMVDSGQGDKSAERMLQAAKEKRLPDGLRIVIEPQSEEAQPADGEHAEAEAKAVESAEAWLVMIDKEQYEPGWEAGAEYYRNAVGKTDFAKGLKSARSPLGDVKSRELTSKKYVTQAPGAPDGQYVILQYKTSFANKESAIETITPMLDKDGKWKVSGYYIK